MSRVVRQRVRHIHVTKILIPSLLLGINGGTRGGLMNWKDERSEWKTEALAEFSLDVCRPIVQSYQHETYLRS